MLRTGCPRCSESASPRWAVSETRDAARGELRSRLRLLGARAADAGEYRCHANNPFGRAERALALRVDGESCNERTVIKIVFSFLF